MLHAHADKGLAHLAPVCRQEVGGLIHQRCAIQQRLERNTARRQTFERRVLVDTPHELQVERVGFEVVEEQIVFLHFKLARPANVDIEASAGRRDLRVVGEEIDREEGGGLLLHALAPGI